MWCTTYLIKSIPPPSRCCGAHRETLGGPPDDLPCLSSNLPTWSLIRAILKPYQNDKVCWREHGRCFRATNGELRFAMLATCFGTLDMSSGPIRILIAEEHPLFRRFLASTVQSRHGLQVVY